MLMLDFKLGKHLGRILCNWMKAIKLKPKYAEQKGPFILCLFQNVKVIMKLAYLKRYMAR